MSKRTFRLGENRPPILICVCLFATLLLLSFSSIAAQNVPCVSEPAFKQLLDQYRTANGRALPGSERAAGSDTAVFIQDLGNKNVSVVYDGVVFGAYLVFEGLIEPTILWQVNQFSGWWADSAQNVTKVLLICDNGVSCGQGTILTYRGLGLADSVDACYRDGIILPSRIAFTGSVHACGDADGSGVVSISDAIYLVNFVFGDGSIPIDAHDGDFNCDGICNITDVFYLVTFVSAAGPAPCNGC